MSGVKDTTKQAAATTANNLRSRLERYGCDVGKTSAKQRNVIGISEAEANANLAHKEPHSDPAYDDTRPLLRVQAATAKEKRAKWRLIEFRGFFA
jgi:hypothetical protein